MLFRLFVALPCLLLTTTPSVNRIKPALNPGENQLSHIVVPVNIGISDLVNSINNKLAGKALYEDYSYEDNGGDGFMMNAWKSRKITLSLQGQTTKYYVPLKLWMKKNLYVGEAEAEGELAIAFKTTFQLKEDWTMLTKTEVEYHEWLTPPVLKTGLGNIPIETIANLALNRSKKELASTIDRTVSQQLSLKPSVQEVWNLLQEPSLLSEEYRMWIKTTPSAIIMTPINTNWNTIRTNIILQCTNEVSFGDKPGFRTNTRLPNLQFIPEYQAPDKFNIRITTDVPFPEAARIAKSMMVGQTFESGRKKATVEDITIGADADKIVVNATLSGTLDGVITFLGKPIFNPELNQIEMKDFDFEIETENRWHKSAAWLLQGPIRKAMRDAMTFPLEQNIQELQQTVQQTLQHYPIQEGIFLSGTVDTIGVENTLINETGIRVNLFSTGKLLVDVKGF
jgi:hypothetical protein